MAARQRISPIDRGDAEQGAGVKVLLDENLPHQLRRELPGHKVYTVAYMGWSGKTNGQLLALAIAGGFDAMLTKDTSIHYQQSVTQHRIALVVLHATSNDIDDIRPLLPELLRVLPNVRPSQVHDIGQSEL